MSLRPFVGVGEGEGARRDPVEIDQVREDPFLHDIGETVTGGELREMPALVVVPVVDRDVAEPQEKVDEGAEHRAPPRGCAPGREGPIPAVAALADQDADQVVHLLQAVLLACRGPFPRGRGTLPGSARELQGRAAQRDEIP